jgi:hypothetical protein
MRDQTPGQKVFSCLGGYAIGFYGGAGAAEMAALGPKLTLLAGFLLAAIGYDLLGGLIAVIAAVRKDPFAALRAFWNRGGSS